MIITTIITNKDSTRTQDERSIDIDHKLCFSPSLSHRQDIPLGHIEGRGVALRVCVVFKQDRVLRVNLIVQCVCVCVCACEREGERERK